MPTLETQDSQNFLLALLYLHRGCTLQENWTLCDHPWQHWLMNLDSLIGHPAQRLYHIWHVWGSTTRIRSLWELQLRKFEWRESGFSLPESPMLASLQSFLGGMVVLFTFYSWCGFFSKVFIDFITILPLLYVLGFWLRGMRDLSFLIGDWTHTSYTGKWSVLFSTNFLLFFNTINSLY